MQSVRDAVQSGASDEALVSAIRSAGKRVFARSAARAFALSRAARGDMASASELARLHGNQPKAWCTEATAALARSVCGDPGNARVRCEGGRAPLIKASIVSGDREAATSGLIDLLEAGDIASALAHARIVGPSCPEAVFDAALNAAAGNRTRSYVEILWTVHRMVGPDKEARAALLDAVIATGSGDVRVKRPSAAEARERMRMIALDSAPRQGRDGKSSAGRRPPGKGGPGDAAADTKTLDIEGFDPAGSGHRVEVVKC